MVVLLLVALSARSAKSEYVLPTPIQLARLVLEEFAMKRANARLPVLWVAALRAKCVALLGNAISRLTPVPVVAHCARNASMEHVVLTTMVFATASATGEPANRLVVLLDALLVNPAPMANVQIMTPKRALVELARLDHANAATEQPAHFPMCA
jgi:type IV secretory pathway VirJ component